MCTEWHSLKEVCKDDSIPSLVPRYALYFSLDGTTGQMILKVGIFYEFLLPDTADGYHTIVMTYDPAVDPLGALVHADGVWPEDLSSPARAGCLYSVPVPLPSLPPAIRPPSPPRSRSSAAAPRPTPFKNGSEDGNRGGTTSGRIHQLNRPC